MLIELRFVQFWSEIILVISNQIRAACSFDFEITRNVTMISDQIALHSVQCTPLRITSHFYMDVINHSFTGERRNSNLINILIISL